MIILDYFDGYKASYNEAIRIDKENKKILIIENKDCFNADELEIEIRKSFSHLDIRNYLSSDISDKILEILDSFGGYHAIKENATNKICGMDLMYIKSEVFKQKVDPYGNLQYNFDTDIDGKTYATKDGVYNLEITHIQCSTFGKRELDNFKRYNDSNLISYAVEIFGISEDEVKKEMLNLVTK